MYGIFTYIWAIFGVNVGKYSSTMEHMGIIINKYNEQLYITYLSWRSPNYRSPSLYSIIHTMQDHHTVSGVIVHL